MIIAAAQTVPKDGDIEKNLTDHYKFIEFASKQKVELIIFPELSLTGYQRDQAAAFSFTTDDTRLSKLQEFAQQKQMILVVGAPIKLDPGLCIGSFIFLPGQPNKIYTKQFLHEGEEIYYIGSKKLNPQISLGTELFSLAICADINNSVHPENAQKVRSTIYLASIFYTKNGIVDGCQKLKTYAEQYSLNILMSNYGGDSWGLEAGGKSSFWASSLNTESSLGQKGEGLIIARKENDIWTSESLGLS